MKNFIAFILILLVISCSPVSWMKIGNGNNMKNSFNNEFTKDQFDSICIVDKLPNNLKKWDSLPLIDGENRSRAVKYMFIQRMDSLEVLYILKKINNKYKLNKRITY